MFENEKKKNCTIFICTKYAIKLGWSFFDLRNSNGKHVFIWSWCVIPFNSWPLFLNSTHNIEIMLFTTTLFFFWNMIVMAYYLTAGSNYHDWIIENILSYFLLPRKKNGPFFSLYYTGAVLSELTRQHGMLCGKLCGIVCVNC